LEALVIVKAVFSRTKYIQIPENPARAKKGSLESSNLIPWGTNSLSRDTAMQNRIIRISTGEKLPTRYLVET
jgi:hypothetical protein